MKIIRSIEDIASLQLGESYIIDYGIDYNDPLSIDYNRVNKLQEQIETVFSTEDIKEKFTKSENKMKSGLLTMFINYVEQKLSVQQIANKFTENELILIGKEVGLDFTNIGSKIDKVTQIQSKL